MSWADPPQQGRGYGGSGMSKSSPQLPPLAHVQRAGTPPSLAASQVSFKDLLPHSGRRTKEYDRGITAAAWSRKLPHGVPSQALRRVRTHLSPVEDAMLTRHTTRLRKAMDEASNGTKYLQTVSVVRRSRSVPALERHALEAALASHIVRAKVQLDRWHAGVTEINEHRRVRNAEGLRKTLDDWNFAEDDPVVVNAREDLDRWRYIEEQMPAVLKKAVEEKDLETIRSNLKELSISGPSSVAGAREARSLMKRYDMQARVLKEAVDARDVEAIRAALDTWEFPLEDANVDEAEATIERREAQWEQLKRVVAVKESINGRDLDAAVHAWEFEIDNAEFNHARKVYQDFKMECEALENVFSKEPVDLLQLRELMDSWSFATDPDSCAAVRQTLSLLNKYTEDVRAAVASKDGYALRELMAAGSNGEALGTEDNKELIAKANDMCTRYAKDSKGILDLVRGAADLQASAKEHIAEKCNEWAFAKTDPVIELGRAWLHCSEVVAESSGKDLEDVKRSGFGGPALGALNRQQALPANSRQLADVQSLVSSAGRVWQAVGAMAFGTAPSEMPDAEQVRNVTYEGMVQHLRAAEIARQRCTSEAGRELKAVAHPPEDVHALLQVVEALLAGSSNYKPRRDDSSWRACQEMIHDHRKFSEHLGEVPSHISSGRRHGITKSRELERQIRAGPLAAEWNADSFGERSTLCESLFSYIESIFRYDDLISAMFATASGDRKSVQDCRFDESWNSLQTLVKDSGGLPDSQLVAAVYLSCGGNATELQRCEARAQTLLDAARKRMLQLQGNLEDISPLDGLVQDSAGGTASTVGPSNPPSMLTLPVQFSGKMLGEFEITEIATGAQLKQLIERNSDFEAPAVGEQRLLNGSKIIRDSKSLVSQGLRSGTTLTLVHVEVSLIHRLELLATAMRALDPSTFSIPEAANLSKAASYFASDGPTKRTGPALRMYFLEFLKDAVAFLQDAAKGKSPQRTRITFCERKIQASMFGSAELPVYQFTTVMFFLQRYALSCKTDAMREASRVFSEFSAVLRKLYDEFLPLYFAWSASAQAVHEAESVSTCASEVASLDQQLKSEIEDVFKLEPEELAEQLESVSTLGLMVGGPHVEALTKAATRQVTDLLKSPDLDHQGRRLRQIEKILAAHLNPVYTISQILGKLGKQLSKPGAPPRGLQEVVYLAPFSQLMVAVFRILAKPGQPDIEFAEAKKELQNGLGSRLSEWQPLKEASVKQLRRARVLLVKIWSILRTGPLHPDPTHNERHRALFAWAAMATSLIPLLPAAQALKPVHDAVKTIVDGVKRKAEESSMAEAEKSSWVLVCQALHKKEEPWWWLRLIGCEDPKGFYVRHGLAVNTSAPLPDVKEPNTEEDEEYEEDEFAEYSASPSVSQPTADANRVQNKRQDNGRASVKQEGTRLTHAQSTFSQAYSQDGFEDDDPGSVQQRGTSFSHAKSAYSQDGFETDDDQAYVQQEAPRMSQRASLASSFPDDFEDDDEEDDDDDDYERDEKPSVPKGNVQQQANPAASLQGSQDDFDADFEQDDDSREAKPMTFASDKAGPREPVRDSRYSQESFEQDDSPVAAKRDASKYSGEFEFEPDDSPQVGHAPTEEADDVYEDFEEDD